MFQSVALFVLATALLCAVMLLVTFAKRRHNQAPAFLVQPDNLSSFFSKAHILVFQSFFIAFTVLELTKVIFGVDLVAILRHWVRQ